MRRLIAVLALIVALSAPAPAARAASLPLTWPDSQKYGAISPDGRWFAYSDVTYPADMNDPSSTYRSDFYAIPLDGGAPRALGSAEGWVSSYDLRWLPNSSGVVSVAHRRAGTQALAFPLAGGGPLALTDVLPLPCIPVSVCGDIVVLGASSNGQVILLVNRLTDFAIYRAAPEGGSPPELLAQLPVPANPNVAECTLPPGGWVVCRITDRIIRVATAGAPHADVLFQTANTFNYRLTISADGSAALIFDRPRPGAHVDLYAIRIAGQPATHAITSYSYDDQALAPTGVVISPDGRYALFTTTLEGGDLKLVPTDGSAAPRTVGADVKRWDNSLNGSLVRLTRPLFTPDSRWVIFQGVCGSGATPESLCRLDLSAPAAPSVQIGPPAASAGQSLRSYAITADGRYAVFAYGVRDIYGAFENISTYALAIDGAPESAAPRSWGDDTYAVAGAGDGFFTASWPSSPLIKGVRAGSARPPQVLDTADDLYWYTSLTPDGRMIYQGTLANGLVRAVIFDLGTLRGGFAAGGQCVGESDGAARVLVSLETAPADTRTVSYAVTGGTADASDYTLPTTGTLTFGPGRRQAWLDVPVAADATPEGPETVLLALSADPASVELTRSAFTLTIHDGREGAHCSASLPFAVRP